jgi:hypothetical protein
MTSHQPCRPGDEGYLDDWEADPALLLAAHRSERVLTTPTLTWRRRSAVVRYTRVGLRAVTVNCARACVHVEGDEGGQHMIANLLVMGTGQPANHSHVPVLRKREEDGVGL